MNNKVTNFLVTAGLFFALRSTPLHASSCFDEDNNAKRGLKQLMEGSTNYSLPLSQLKIELKKRQEEKDQQILDLEGPQIPIERTEKEQRALDRFGNTNPAALHQLELDHLTFDTLYAIFSTTLGFHSGFMDENMPKANSSISDRVLLGARK